MNKLLLTTALAFGLAGAAVAAPVNYAGEVEGAWTSETGGNTFIAGDTLFWGASLFRLPSTLFIDDNPSDPDFSGSVNMGTSGHAEILTFEWENRRTLDSKTPDNFTATADVNVEWTSPGSQMGAETLSFFITNTQNNPNDPDTAAVSVTTGALDFGAPFRIGNLWVSDYFFEVSGAGSWDGTTWINPEGQTSYLTLKANVAAVPLPAAGWMLLAGLGGLAAMRRRNKTA